MGSSYRQFCPVAKAMEVLDERWTLLVVRELVAGSEHFNELRRGLPRMSPSLLSTRLRHLERVGVVERVTDGGGVRYVLTAAGNELRPVVEALGAWGVRWVTDMTEEDQDPSLLLWDMHRHVDHTTVPQGRTVVQFRFADAPPGSRTWWIVLTPQDAEVCDFDPGYDVAVTVTVSLRQMIEIWRGDLTWGAAVRAGAVELEGPASLRRAVPQWFTPSDFAAVPRPAPRAVKRPAGGPVPVG